MLGHLAKRRRHRLVRRQMERVHHGCLQLRRQPDCGRVEGMIVDHVIPHRLNTPVGDGESGLGAAAAAALADSAAAAAAGPASPAGPAGPKAR